MNLGPFGAIRSEETTPPSSQIGQNTMEYQFLCQWTTKAVAIAAIFEFRCG